LPSFLFEDQRRFSRAAIARYLERGHSGDGGFSYLPDPDEDTWSDRQAMRSDKFNKFTDRARKVLSLAQEEAQRFQHNYIGTEHLLLGLVREGDGVAAKVLMNLGIELNKARSAVEFVIVQGDRIVLGEIGLTPRARKAIDLAVDEARRFDHHYIGTEHLLLGLIHEGEGIAAGVLESLGVNLERARRETIRVLIEREGDANS
jgi:ATP-dependent Clp protease ATP-binding subunit ClpC